MNKERILELAGFLDTLDPNKFDMGTFGYEDSEYGTVACIAGWTVARWLPSVFDYWQHPEDSIGETPDTILKSAKDLLGLTTKQADALFIPSNVFRFDDREKDNLHSLTWYAWKYETDISRVTSRQAAKVLRHLADTGIVDWGIAFDEEAKKEGETA